jgi:hypothetical protein
VSHPNTQLIKQWESNRRTLERALIRAGGVPDRILNEPEVFDFLLTLASNNINIAAQYHPPVKKAEDW